MCASHNGARNWNATALISITLETLSLWCFRLDDGRDGAGGGGAWSGLRKHDDLGLVEYDYVLGFGLLVEAEEVDSCCALGCGEV